MKQTKTILFHYFKAIFFAALAAQPSSLFLLWLEGSVIRFLGWILTFGFIQVVGMIGCLVIGFPAHFLLQKLNLKSRMAYVFSGFITPLLVFASGPIIFMDWDELFNLDNISLAMVFAVAGAASAFVLHHYLADE